MPTRNINLTDHLDTFVTETLKSGRYSNASEVVREALRMLQDREAMDALKRHAFKAEIEAALADINAGRFTEFDTPKSMTDHLKTLREKARGAQIA